MDLESLKQFTGSLAAPAMLFNESGVVLVANQAAESLFGIGKKTVIDELFDHFIVCPREYAGNVPKYLKDFRENSEEYWARPIFATHTSGQRLALNYSVNSYEADGKECIELVLFQDITEGHQTYFAMKQQLEEESSLSKVKTRFLHHIAQNMRMPINNVLNTMSEALDTADLSPEALVELDAAYHSGRDLQRTFGELTDFLHLEIGDLDLPRVTFNVRAELEGFVDNLMPVARRQNLELATLISPYVPDNLIGDPKHILQVLQSLLNNAFRFTYEGGISVRVSCDVETDTHATLQIEVSDTGGGIPEERVQQMRDSLLQEGGSMADRSRGLGIGLAISKQLMDRMGGRLTVRSTEGLGTTFGMVLELPKAAVTNAKKGEITGRSVLLVNDAMDDRKRLEEYCEVWGMSYQVAGHGSQAISVLEQNLNGSGTDFVIIDLHKMKKSGIKLAKQIREHRQFNSSKLILLASNGDGISPASAEKHGVNAYVEKPLRREDLHNALTLLTGQEDMHGTMITAHTMGDVKEQQTRRALLVEDNEVNQIIAKGALKKLGINADVTNNGEEAIDAIQDKHYDIVLMDCEMPIMDGFEATRMIREWEKEQGKHIPIIALTADDTEDCRKACREAGMDDFMIKPFRSDQLQIILKNLNA